MTQAVEDETMMKKEHKASKGGAAWWVVALAVVERGWLVDKSCTLHHQSSRPNAMQGTGF